MKAPFGREGGKSRLALRLIDMFPVGYNRFIEPFLGAGNIFYRTNKVDEEIINDLDKDMYIIHKGLQKEGDVINKKFRRKLTKEQFDKIKTKTDPVSVLEKYKHSFKSSGKSYNDKEDPIKTDFSVYKDRLKGVKILNQDYKKLIKDYDSPTSFFYLDPPYEKSSETTKYTHSELDPKDLYDALQGIKGKFMISYNNSENIRNIFKKYNIYKIKTLYTDPSGGGQTIPVTELVITNYKNNSKDKMDGDGLLREAGKLPPSARKQLESIGNEKIKKIVAVRTPLSSTTKAFLNIISLGQFEKISKKYFDELFHLAFWINDKYNLEKNEVISFGTKNPIKSNSETQTITINKDITFNELMENTRKYMGDNNFTSYNAEKNNCQNFLLGILNGNGIGTDTEKKWIKQDTDAVFKEVPAFAKVLGNLSTTAGAIVNRLIEGEGRPRRLYMTDDGRYYYMKDNKKRFIKMPADISQKQVVKINIGNLVKPKKKRKRKAVKRLVKPEVIGTITKTGLPPPVLIREQPKPKSGDESKELLKSIEGILKLVPREPTRIGQPEPVGELKSLQNKLKNIENELENTKREEKQAREELVELEKQLKNIDNEIMGARLEGARNMLVMKEKELKELENYATELQGELDVKQDSVDYLGNYADELEEQIEDLENQLESKGPKGTAALGKSRVANLPEILKQFVTVYNRPPRDVDEINKYIFSDDGFSFDPNKYTKISKAFLRKTMEQFKNQMEAILTKETEPVESLLSSTSKMAGKGIENPCYNPLSIAFANMPIGIETNNPLFKTNAFSTSTAPTPTTTTTTTTETKKDEPQKPDQPQKGQGLFGDVINLFNPSTTTTTRILGLGFGMAGGCNGMDSCQCGNGVVGDFLNSATEKFQKLKAEADADIQLRKTNPKEWQRRQDAKKAEMDRLSKIAEEERRIKEEKKKQAEAELNRKLNRPLEWYEKAGKFLTGQVVGKVPVIGAVTSAVLQPEVECAMRDLTKEECRMFRERQSGKGEEQVDGLYNDEIETIADNLGIKVPVIASDEIDKIVDMINPSTKEFGFIMNTDDSKGAGKHWRAIFIDNDEDRPSIEYFDPLGDAPEPQLIEDIKKIADKLDNEKYFLFKESMVKRQSDDTNTCGHHSLKFLEDRFNGVSWAEATGFKKCINQEGEGEKEILKTVKKYENYL